ncbi:MAG: VWA domain-containing protein [Spirochaetales bacterium]|nr:VWA domain-containing protein [Spirochaetales bacterium]
MLEYSWQYPFMFFLLPVAWIWVIVRNRLEQKTDPVLASPPGGSRLLRPTGMFLEACLLSLLLLALAGPQTKESYDRVEEEGIDIALVLDISASMQAADFQPNRLEALKKTTAEFIKRSGHNRIGMYAFAGAVFTQTPLTTDHQALLEMLEGLSYEMIDHVDGGGTAIGDALVYAMDSLRRSRIKDRDQAIVLITDGENSSGMDPRQAAQMVYAENIKLFIIGMAGPEEVEVYVNGKPFITSSDVILKTSLDDKQLEAITQAGGGRYFRAHDDSALAALMADLGRLSRTPLEIRRLELKIPRDGPLLYASLIAFILWLAWRSFLYRRPML